MRPVYEHLRWAKCQSCGFAARYAVFAEPGKRIRDQRCFRCKERTMRAITRRALVGLPARARRPERLGGEHGPIL